MFLLSGAAALIYQIVWVKKLTLVFGVTLYSTSAVITTFMAGLAFGSLYFGRVVDRWKRPLVLFALLELGIAAFALVFPAIVDLLRQIYVVFYGPFGDSPHVMTLVRFVMAFLVLIVPTSLMGGTLPVITRAYVVRGRQLGRGLAGLYSANNIGAFAGCVAAGYLFLEWLGPGGTLKLAAGMNLAVAVVSLGVARYMGTQQDVQARPTTDEPTEQPVALTQPRPLSGPVKVALWVFALEGVASLVYQMAWMRMLVFFVRSDIYGVTAVVATFLVGLSLGAFMCKRWVDRLRNPYRALGIIEFGIGLTALATIPLLPFLLSIHQSTWSWAAALHAAGPGGGRTFLAAVSAANFAVTFLVIIVPTAFMGATLPVVSKIYVAERDRLGRKIGVLGCLDTVGSIFGAFAGGFLLIPLLGIQRTIIGTVLLNFALAGWVFLVDPIARRTVGKPIGVAVTAGAILVGLGFLTVQPTPLIKYSDLMMNQPTLELVQYEEDQIASVSVLERLGFARELVVDHDVVGGTFRHDRPSHEVVLHVPLLMHPEPKRALIVGLGLGMSVGACLAHDVEVDVVELSPSVVRVNRQFDACFEQYIKEHGGRSVLEDARVNVRVEDGRNFVLGTAERYDVIHVGGFHPHTSSGAAGFYTVEFYQDCRRILTPDGVFTQWLPVHGISAEDFKMILRSFRAGFPHSSVWYKYTGDFCMLAGTVNPLEIDFQRFERGMDRPQVLKHLGRCNVEEVWDLLDFFCFDGEGIDAAVGSGPLHTDEHPYLEYHAQRVFSTADSPDRLQSLALLTNGRRRVRPFIVNIPESDQISAEAQLERWFQATQELTRAHWLGPQSDFKATAAAYEKAITTNPADKNARLLWNRYLAGTYYGLAQRSLDAGEPRKAVTYLQRAIESSPDTRSGTEARALLDALRGDWRGPLQ